MALRRPRTSLLALAAGAALVAHPPTVARQPTPELDFGRFSERLVRCVLSTPTSHRSQRSCGRLRIEQNLEGVLSVRFNLSAGNERYSSEDLVFAGMLSGNSAPMACRGDGRCQPRFPVVLSVNAISTGVYDRRGLAATLPRARVARGLCRIEAVRATCEATERDGERWRAEGFFLGTQPPDVRAAQR